jgi:putative acetyltransferase
MIKCIRTNSANSDFKKLVVAYEDEEPAGCGAIKEYKHDIMEIKRVFVPPDKRGKGIATEVLKELEQWTRELNYKKCILETGKKQQEAISLYLKNQYKRIPNYGQYENVENSVCFEKVLIE